MAGASGLVGQAVVSEYAARQDCEVIAVSRRAPYRLDGARFISADLRDAAACQALFSAMDDITHVVYTALFEKPGLVPGWREHEQIQTNAAMLENLLGPLAGASAATLQHVSLLQGTKAYGVHVEPFPVPAREQRSERHDLDNFYWLHEQYLKDRQAGQGWHYTIFRPQIIFGLSLGSAMNLIPAIGVYAAILREQGRPLVFPGGPGNLLEAVDADLLARSIAWAGEAETARNRIFNVTNGDVFCWRNIWPALADMLGMEAGPAEPRRLGETMAADAATWDRIRAREGLVAPAMDAFVGESFHYADFCFAWGAEGFSVEPALVSTIQLRQAGFAECMDTEAMFEKWFRLFERERLLPSP